MTIPNISVMITKSRTGLLTGYAKIIGSKDPGKENVMSRVAVQTMKLRISLRQG